MFRASRTISDQKTLSSEISTAGPEDWSQRKQQKPPLELAGAEGDTKPHRGNKAMKSQRRKRRKRVTKKRILCILEALEICTPFSRGLRIDARKISTIIVRKQRSRPFKIVLLVLRGQCRPIRRRRGGRRRHLGLGRRLGCRALPVLVCVGSRHCFGVLRRHVKR